MAKYVGKIFRVNNTLLKIKRNGTHYVHVKWYNPFTRKFRCKIITSLEKQTKIDSNNKRLLGRTPFHKENDVVYSLFLKNKYSKVRNGEIEPIPVTKMEGFSVWSAYSGSRDLSVRALKGKEQSDMWIKK